MEYEIENYDENDDFVICEDCGKRILLDEAIYLSVYGKYVCEDCLKEYTKCDSCGEYINNSEIVYIEETNEWICERCLEQPDYE